MAGQRLGQHFLADERILSQMAEWVCPRAEPLVIEIGPGRGALTRHLLARAQRLVAIELDVDLAEGLRGELRASSNLEIVVGDVLDQDLAQWGPAVVAGNLPYYITSPILRKVLAMKTLRRAVFLVQREVAERMAAPPGSRDYGYLSVLVQSAAVITGRLRVRAGAFRPAPRVESEVVVLEPATPSSLLSMGQREEFLDFAGVCFRQKRKTLRNNLLTAYPRELVEDIAEGRMRAEQLSIDCLAGIWNRLRTGKEEKSVHLPSS